jgi:galactoside O-acetyltransferase
MNSFYNQDELTAFGFNQLGKNVKISRLASIYGPENISLGNNIRIDDFCILSGKITMGNNIHIAAGCFMFSGNTGIELEDFVNVSSRSVIYAVTDDYSGIALIGPTIPLEYRSVIQAKVTLKKHVVIGTSVVILPGVIIDEGCAVGALSLVNKSLPAWKICLGIPAKHYKDRKIDLLDLESEYLSITK